MAQSGASRGDPVAASTRAYATGRHINNLPLELTSFIGREREIAEVEGLPATHRLVTLTGPGGCGKTRLALAVGSALAEDFDDGTWWVGLASLSDPDLVAQSVASALGVRETPGRPLAEALADHLGPKETLLILDNCEHVIDACAALVDALLHACPNLRVLAASREALNLAGETTWLVPPLSLPDSSRPQDLGTLTDYEAVRLFVERARAVASTFSLTPENAPAVASLCRQLDGMPLAIELAASRVRALSPPQILDRLSDRFRLLTGGGRIAAPRHRTLRATMDWSHERLSEEEKVLFRRLSVFAGGWALEAAEAVCAGGGILEDEVLDLLTRLVDQSLVVVREWEGEARYRLLETVRQYAKEKLEESGENEGVGRRHAEHFLELAETAEAALLGPEQEAWVGHLEVEHDNLRAALDWSERTGATEAGLRLAGALPRFWIIRGHFTEGQARLKTLLALPEAPARSAARAKACYALGSLFYRRGNHAAGDLEEARTCMEESLDIFRQVGDEVRTAAALTELGSIDTEFGEYDSARASFEESLMLQRRLGDEHGIARTANGLGWLDFLRGEPARARPLLEESLAILRKLGDKFYLGGSVLYLGCLDCEQGDYGAARSRFVELTRLVSFQQYRYVAPLVLEAFVVLAAAQDQAVHALRLAGAAAGLRRVMGWQFRLSWERYVNRRLEPAWQALVGQAEGAAAWADGEMMTLEQAFTYALQEEPTTPLWEAQGSPELPAGPSLSVRELEVLGLVAEGLTDAQVAQRLHLSPRTVGRHLEGVYRKLGVSSRTAAVRTAGELGLL